MISELTVVIGWAAVVVTVFLSLPQIVRLIRTRNTDGIAILNWQMAIAGCLAWIVHAIRFGAPNMFTSNILYGAMAVVVVYLIAKNRQRSFYRILMLFLCIGVGYIALDLIFGAVIFGITLAAIGFVANFSQVLAVIRSRSIAGLSPAYLFMRVGLQMLWLTWAVLAQETSTFINSCVLLTMATFIALWWLLRRFGLRALKPYPPAEPAPGT